MNTSLRYECTGSLTIDGFKVTHWAPAPPNDAARLRRHLLKRYGTDYGASDDYLNAAIEQAHSSIGGRRLSWIIIASERVIATAAGPEALG